MKVKLELHRYAPELNKAHFLKGGSIKIPAGIETIKQFRDHFLHFKKADSLCRQVIVHVRTPDTIYPDYSVEKGESFTYRFVVRANDYKAIKLSMLKLKAKHNLPQTIVKISMLRLAEISIINPLS